jgi:hypothetical protein
MARCRQIIHMMAAKLWPLQTKPPRGEPRSTVATRIRVSAGFLAFVILASLPARGDFTVAPATEAPPMPGMETQAPATQSPAPAPGAEVSPTGAPASAPAPHAPPIFRAEQLDQLLAPIALYPDPLLAQILMAATYPLEIVRARRWLQDPGHSDLQGAQLAAALEAETWDPSVKSLVAFPQILGMMDDRLEWTERLGNAFLAQQGDVMDAIQRLRNQAAAAGTLWSTAQQRVTTEGQGIVIEPMNPALIYPPVYNPDLAYGPWPYPDFPPLDIVPPDYDPGFGLPFGIGFGIGFVVIQPFRCAFDWTQRQLLLNIDKRNAFDDDQQGRKPDIWQHDPAHRHGVPYVDTGSRERFGGSPAHRVSVAALPRAEIPSLTASAPTISRGASPRADAVLGRGPAARIYLQRSGTVRQMNAPRMMPWMTPRQPMGWIIPRTVMASSARLPAGSARLGGASHR